MCAGPTQGVEMHDASCGTIVELWRYPVKSMLGERCAAVDVNARGVDGDRRYAVRTAAGKFGSGKSTRRFQYVPGLFGFRAIYRDDVPEVTFPNGQILRADDPAIHTALSTNLGQPVMLAREGAISHFDAGPVHLLTTATLAWVHAHLPDSAVDVRRFRPNLVVAVLGTTPVEHAWCGRTLAIGDTMRLRISIPTERCVMVTFAQAELPKDPQVLRWITQAAGAQLGVYADVVVPGRVRRGDRVQLVV